MNNNISDQVTRGILKAVGILFAVWFTVAIIATVIGALTYR